MYASYHDISVNMRSQDRTRKECLPQYADVLVCQVDKGSNVMVGFSYTWHKLELSWKRNINPSHASIQTTCSKPEEFSWLVISMGVSRLSGGCISWEGGPGYIKKEPEQSIRSKPVNNTPPWILLSVLPTGSCLEFLPWIPSVLHVISYLAAVSKSCFPS